MNTFKRFLGFTTPESEIMSQEYSNISSSMDIQQIQNQNNFFHKVANQDNTRVAFTGKMYEVNGKKRELACSEIVFSIKSILEFRSNIFVFSKKGQILVQKPITIDLQYDVNQQSKCIRWKDKGSKIIQVIFDQNNTVKFVKLCLAQCFYEFNSQKRYSNSLKQNNQNQYVKNLINDIEHLINSDVTQQTQQNIKNSNIYLSENKQCIVYEANKNEKYKRVMIQCKKSNSLIVSSGNILYIVNLHNQQLKIVKTIKLQNMNHQEIIPEKMLINNQDTLLLIKDIKNKVYFYDLVTNSIIKDFSNTKVQIKDIVEQKRGSNDFKMFIGISDNGIYRIDFSNGISEKHVYKGNEYQFYKIISTLDGNYAIGSQDGTIRLYNNLNNKVKAINKFTNQQKIIHLDATRNGNWILATFETQLVLFPTYLDEISLFQSSVKVQDRRNPIKLNLTKQNIQFLKTNKFTASSFNHSQQFIITSVGDHIIKWVFLNILKGYKDYQFIKAINQINQVELRSQEFVQFIVNINNEIIKNNGY